MTTILFGTDSTASAGWNLWEHLRLARATRMLSDEALFATMTTTAAEFWALAGRGRIAVGQPADLVLAKAPRSNSIFDRLFAINPADILLLMHKGQILSFDDALRSRLKNLPGFSRFSHIGLNGQRKWVKGNLPAVVSAIRDFAPMVSPPVDID